MNSRRFARWFRREATTESVGIRAVWMLTAAAAVLVMAGCSGAVDGSAVSTPDAASAHSNGSANGGTGDLGLSIPITKPECDGIGIVVVEFAITPGEYATEIGAALAEHPGFQYLRTDQACPSLMERNNHGDLIYFVYKPVGYKRGEVCAAVHREGGAGHAEARWLDMESDRGHPFC